MMAQNRLGLLKSARELQESMLA